MANRVTFRILCGMVLGVVTGAVIHWSIGNPADLKSIASAFGIVTTLFLRLIKMIIAPLVLGTLIGGIAHIGDSASLGRVGVRTIGWFLVASLLSLSLGLTVVNLVQPGVGLGLPLPSGTGGSGLARPDFNATDFVAHIFPASIVDAMAHNDILPIVVFAVFAGVALTAIGDKARPIVAAAESLTAMMLKVTDYVMRTAPIAVFAAIAQAVTINGLAILSTFGKFVGSFYLGLAALWTMLLLVAWAFLGPRVVHLVRAIRAPVLLAFATASSEAAYPRTLEALERFGVPPRIASFVLPLGYSFNLDGSMMYMTFAIMFVAQAYGIHLSLADQGLMVLVLMVSSKGMAGVPRASLVVVAGVMPRFGIPEAGILLVLAVDQFLDMGRSGTNVVGNAISASVIARWEGALVPPTPD